jgi:hypothetical protein
MLTVAGQIGRGVQRALILLATIVALKLAGGEHF